MKHFPYPCRSCGEPCTKALGLCLRCTAKAKALTRKPRSPNRLPNTSRWPKVPIYLVNES